MNTGNTYYFIDDSNNICKQENGVQKEFSEVLELQDLIDEVNNLIDKNEQLKCELKGSRMREDDLHKYLKEIKEENEKLKQQVRQLSLIGEKQAKFIQSKGFDIKELIDFAREGSND